jgi:amino acid adenylation domain-containing protein
MKKIEDFLAHLVDLNITLSVKNGKLRISAPENTLTDELREQLRERKPEIIAFLNNTPFSDTTVEETIPPLSRDNKEFPLSFAQQRLWFLEQLEGKTATYNIPMAMRLDGKLHQHALEQSLQEMIKRHDVLRTTFKTVNGNPVQVIDPITNYQLPLIDLQELPFKKQNSEVQRLISEENHHPLDLSKGPLFYVKLLKLEAEAHILLINMHHIISDGWSSDIFIREWSLLYAAFQQGQPSPLPPLQIQYADFAHWQRKRLTGKKIEQQLHYWMKQLSDAPALLGLPTDYPRPPVQRFKGAGLPFTLSSKLTEGLKHLGRESGATLFMTLWAAFSVLLYRYSGQPDIIIGSPIANRTHKQTESLIGFFVNTLVLRLQLADNRSFKEILLKARQIALDAYSHQDIPFELLVENLNPPRNMSYSPLFQVMLVFQNTPSSTFSLQDLEVTVVNAENQTTKFDLNFHLSESTEGIIGTLYYNTDLFTQQTINGMLEHFHTMLDDIVANPDKRLSAFALLNPSQRHRLSKGSNKVQPTLAYQEFQKQETTLVERFEQQVNQYPQHIAVKTKNNKWTYAQLNEKANQAAHTILEACAEEEGIALLFEQDAAMIVGIMGTLKAGKWYVPLDPNYPRQRLEYILQDSQAKTILTDSKSIVISQSLANNTLNIIDLDEIKPSVSRENCNTTISGDTNAYLLYTSGSTGRPKGVIQNHRNVLHFIRHYTNSLHITVNDRLTLLSSYSFDAAIVDIFTALLNGATLYPINLKEDKLTELSHQLIEEQITIYHSIPTVFRHFIQTLTGKENFPHLRLIVFGGEAVDKENFESYKKRFPASCILINLFGSTESTISLQYFLNQQTENSHSTLPIGYPIAETELLLLDSDGEKTEVYGEIAIRSPYLTPGYWQQPLLTQKTFLPDPDGGNRRIYRTGDMGRLLPDGNIEFAGRKDFQVKIRGFRVELGEIEAVLNSHPAVQENVVLVQESSKGDNILSALLVPMKGHVIDIQELRSFLKARLPNYMVPLTFTFKETLPHTPNGKVNREALQLEDLDYQLSQEGFVTPRTPDEELLAGIWADVLGIDSICIYDNFFELGGHSLLATQIMSRIRDTFKVELPLRDLFASPTIASLNKNIQAARHQSLLPPIKPVDRSAPLHLSFAQQRLWFLNQSEGPNAIYNMAAALRLEGPLDQKALEHSLQAMVMRHETLRTTFPMIKGVPVIKVSENHHQLSIMDLMDLLSPKQDIEIRRLINEEVHRSFDLEKGPLFRSQLFKLNRDTHVILLNMHHIISDAWSIGVFIREWSAFYLAFTKGNPSPLPPLPIQYVDFAHWQQQWFAGDVLEEQKKYWKHQLTDIPSLLKLPTDFPRPTVQGSKGASIPFMLTPQITAQVKLLSRKSGTTVFMILWSAFATLLSRWSGQKDIVIGSPIANRTQSQSESLIGFFVNILVLRLNLTENPSFKNLLDQARNVALEAYAHQDLPFEQLVKMLQPERIASHTPLFQVMLVLQNAPMTDLQLSDLKLSSLPIPREAAQFDLTLGMAEQEGQLVGEMNYQTDLFQPETIQRLLEHLEILLSAMVTDEECSVFKLPMMSNSEQERLAQWNDPLIINTETPCIHQLIEKRVEETPEAIAVVFGEQRLCYKELNLRANQLAGYLHTRGVGPEIRVALCLDRSLEVVIAILAIWKAGGVYVPLDPTYPKNRREFLLMDSSTSLLLTQREFAQGLSAFPGETVFLDTCWQEIENQSAENPGVRIFPDNLAYVIYTSGTSGEPKGVMATHRGLVNLAEQEMALFNVHRNSRILQFVSLGFDVSMSDLTIALCSGAALHLAHGDGVFPGPGLIKLLAEEKITHAEFPAAVLATLPNSDLPELQCLVVGGEASRPEIVSSWSQGRQYFNAYGPTETTICATAHLCDPQTLGSPPIGRPLGFMRAYVLDSYQNRVPIGVIGELFIGGIGVTRGYLGQPALTSEKFLPDPFSELPGQRMYRTGDFVRFLVDGCIEFINRIDQQVKIRGFRIELEEIESALLKHPEVEKAVVTVREDQPGDKRLMGYVTARNGNPFDTDQILAFLKERLPKYMIPANIIPLQKLPLTSNGKVNRKALPNLEPVQDHQMAQKAPGSPIEKGLHEIWTAVLGNIPIGIQSNFFELGGHSLDITRVHYLIQEKFLVEIPLKQLFDVSNIADLAVIVQQEQKKGGTLQIPQIKRVSRESYRAQKKPITTKRRLCVKLIHCGNKNIANPEDKSEKNIFFAPMGLFAMAHNLKEKGFDIEIIHLDLESGNLEDILDFSTLDAVGLDCHWANQSLVVINTAELIKQIKPEVFVFLGGYTSSFFNREILSSYSYIDAVIRGDGEVPIVELCSILEKRKYAKADNKPEISMENVPNLSWKGPDNQVILNPFSYVASSRELDSLHFSDLILMRNWKYYRDLSKFWTRFSPLDDDSVFFLEVGRGCPYNCSFCGGNARAQKCISNREGHITRSIDSIMETIRDVAVMGYKLIYVTFEFAGSDEWYSKLFRRIKQEKISIHFGYGSWALPSKFLIDELSQCFEHSIIEISPETADLQLRRKNKDRRLYYTNEELEECLQYVAKKSNVKAQLYFGYFLADETEETVFRTLDYCGKLFQEYPQVAEVLYFNLSTDPASLLFFDPEKYNMDILVNTFKDYLKALEEKYILKKKTRQSDTTLKKREAQSNMTLFRPADMSLQQMQQLTGKIELYIRIFSLCHNSLSFIFEATGDKHIVLNYVRQLNLDCFEKSDFTPEDIREILLDIVKPYNIETELRLVMNKEISNEQKNKDTGFNSHETLVVLEEDKNIMNQVSRETYPAQTSQLIGKQEL